MAKRLVAGIDGRQTPIALDIVQDLGHKGNYLSHPHTKKWFREELYIPSEVIDRDSLEAWEKKGSKSAWDRAKERVDDLLSKYESPPISNETRKELHAIASHVAEKAGMMELPSLPMD